MQRLATYGTLGPGRSNHHVVAEIPGRWMVGTVRGTLVADGWGAEYGFPGIVLSQDGDVVRVDVLESPSLADHWERLDDFEGPGYQRVPVEVATPNGVVEAYIYALSGSGGPEAG